MLRYSLWSSCRLICSNKPMDCQATAMFRVAIILWAAWTSNSENATLLKDGTQILRITRILVFPRMNTNKRSRMNTNEGATLCWLPVPPQDFALLRLGDHGRVERGHRPRKQATPSLQQTRRLQSWSPGRRSF